MVEIWQAAGEWYVNVDGVETRHATERKATDYVMAQMVSEIAIEQELAQDVTGFMLPNLREYRGKLANMQLSWQANDMDGKIAKAIEAKTSIAGFSPEVWVLWGKTFNLLQEFLESKQDAIGGLRPLDVLMRRYVAQAEQ